MVWRGLTRTLPLFMVSATIAGITPPVPVTEAGGRFTNLDGRDGPHGPGAIATNGVLHDEVVARLAIDAD